MSEQQETILPSKVTPSRPTTNDSTAWSMYWHALGQKWRTEPEIDDERQKALFNLLTTISPDRPHMYPFLAVKLTRAEVEWLIANPPVDKEKYLELLKKILEDKEKLGKLSKQQFVDLRREVYDIASSSQTIDLRGADLRGVALSNLPLSEARLEDADLSSANLRGAFLHGAHLERAILDGALLENTSLSGAHLEFASLAGAHLERASLRNAHLEGAVLTNTHLEGACLAGTFFDSTTKLDDIHLSSKYHGSALIGDVHWDDADLSGVNWEQVVNSVIPGAMPNAMYSLCGATSMMAAIYSLPLIATFTS
jgi:Pentapeptide repeats (8 copies)